MTVKEMYQMVLDLVGLETMPEDSGVIYDNGKDVKRVLAGIDMNETMLLLAKQLGFDCVAQHHPGGIITSHTGDYYLNSRLHLDSPVFLLVPFFCPRTPLR